MGPLSKIFQKIEQKTLNNKMLAAAAKLDFMTAMTYIDDGADPNYVGKTRMYDITELNSFGYIAVSMGDSQTLEALLAKGLDPNGYIADQEYPLLPSAVEKGLKSVARVLIEHGANCDYTYAATTFYNPMTLAEKADSRCIEEIAALIKSKTTPQSPAAVAETPTAAQNNSNDSLAIKKATKAHTVSLSAKM